MGNWYASCPRVAAGSGAPRPFVITTMTFERQNHMTSRGEIERYSLILKRVEYQLSMVESSEGTVVAHRVDTGRVIVIDDDGSKWKGWEDHTTVLTRNATDASDQN